MVSQIKLNGFEEFSKYTESIDSKGPPVVFYFSGSKNPDGNSWCPDCVEVTMAPKKATTATTSNPAEKPYLNNYDEFNVFSEKQDAKKNVYFMFTGRKKENAEPVVNSYLGELHKKIIFAYVDVGDMPYWKDKACPFRTDPRTRLMVIPTIIKWKGVQRLEGAQCTKRELLQMLFEDED